MFETSQHHQVNVTRPAGDMAGDACISLGRGIQNLRIGLKLRMLWDKIRSGRQRTTGVGNDEDGSMMQGLLLRENL